MTDQRLCHSIIRLLLRERDDFSIKIIKIGIHCCIRGQSIFHAADLSVHIRVAVRQQIIREVPSTERIELAGSTEVRHVWAGAVRGDGQEVE